MVRGMGPGLWLSVMLERPLWAALDRFSPGGCIFTRDEHSSLAARHHLVMCLLCASNIFMRRLINAFSFYLHRLTLVLARQTIKTHPANNTLRYFWFLSKNLISNSCRHLFVRRIFIIWGVGNDAHNFLMNLYRENYFGKCLKWLNRMNFQISAEGA